MSAPGGYLPDLARTSSRKNSELPQWFAMDGIHFRPAGREWIAGRIAEFLRDDVLAKSGK
jgi:lysophospholipase L1-like esterase